MFNSLTCIFQKKFVPFYQTELLMISMISNCSRININFIKII